MAFGGFIPMIKRIANNSELPETTRKKLVDGLEIKGVTTYLDRIGKDLGIEGGTTDAPMVAAALKVHYDILTKTMDPDQFGYTEYLARKVSDSIKIVNISIDVGGLIEAMRNEQDEDTKE